MLRCFIVNASRSANVGLRVFAVLVISDFLPDRFHLLLLFPVVGFARSLILVDFVQVVVDRTASQ